MQRPLRLLTRLVIGAFVFNVSLRAESDSSTDGIALAVVFDTSGSMRDPMEYGTSNIRMEAKYRIARRSFEAVIKRLEAFAASPSRSLQVGVFVFRENKAATAVPITMFDPIRLRAWLSRMTPEGGTPLGDTLYLAASELLKTKASARHLLVLTDGDNNSGRKPESVLASVQRAALKRESPVFVHIIALDIAPAVFGPLEKQGATLIGASNAHELDAQFDFILEEKILVEASR